VRSRNCPADTACHPIVGWEPFVRHIYERHTSPEFSEAERWTTVQKILAGRPAAERPVQDLAPALDAHLAMLAEWDRAGHPKSACSGHTFPTSLCPAPQVHDRMFPAVGRPATVIPKVTADPRTAALWFLTEGDKRSAGNSLSKLSMTERRAYLAHLTELISMLWEA
jgi:hypothetical protein